MAPIGESLRFKFAANFNSEAAFSTHKLLRSGSEAAWLSVFESVNRLLSLFVGRIGHTGTGTGTRIAEVSVSAVVRNKIDCVIFIATSVLLGTTKSGAQTRRVERKREFDHF